MARVDAKAEARAGALVAGAAIERHRRRIERRQREAARLRAAQHLDHHPRAGAPAALGRGDRDARDAERRHRAAAEELAHRDLEQPAEHLAVPRERFHVLDAGHLEPARDVLRVQAERVSDDVVKSGHSAFSLSDFRRKTRPQVPRSLACANLRDDGIRR